MSYIVCIISSNIHWMSNGHWLKYPIDIYKISYADIWIYRDVYVTV